MNLKKVKVGDTLYDPGVRSDSRQNRKPNILHVHKIARKYLYASISETYDPKSYLNQKIDLTTGRVDGWMGYSVYVSEEHYNEFLYRQELSRKIKNVFGANYSVNVPDITTEQLRDIAKTLGVEL